MSKKSSAYVQDYLKFDYIGLFLLNRRVKTVLYSKYKMRGYEIDLLLLIVKHCEFKQDTEIYGRELRKCISLRFARIFTDVINNLREGGYITAYKKADSKQSWHRIAVTDKGLEFYDVFLSVLVELLKEDRDQLIISMTDRRKDDKKGKGFKKKKKDVQA